MYVAVESGAWLVNVYPICEKFPCTREEFRGSWEDRFNFDYVTKMYEKLKLQGALASFYQELMLQILSDDTRLISETDVKWYYKKTLLEKRANFNFYITTDFATSEKQFSDFSFISVWAVNNKGFKYWVDGICKRQTMDKNIDDLFRIVTIYTTNRVNNIRTIFRPFSCIVFIITIFVRDSYNIWRFTCPTCSWHWSCFIISRSASS